MKPKQIVKAILAIATFILLLCIAGGNDLQMSGVPQVCTEYKGEIVCYQP